MSYIVRDVDGTGEANHIVALPELELGTYIINVVPKAGVMSTDTYGLELRLFDEAGNLERTVPLAEHVAVGEIPRLGYGVDSTGTGVSAYTRVAIDIKPGAEENPVNAGSNGRIPVAILSAPGFSATSQVDRSSLRFGPSGDESSLAFCNAGGEDVNSDGVLDLVCHFDTPSAPFVVGTTRGVLTGRTIGGQSIRGEDVVRVH